MTKSPFTIRLDRDKAFACIKPPIMPISLPWWLTPFLHREGSQYCTRMISNHTSNWSKLLVEIKISIPHLIGKRKSEIKRNLLALRVCFDVLAFSFIFFLNQNLKKYMSGGGFCNYDFLGVWIRRRSLEVCDWFDQNLNVIRNLNWFVSRVLCSGNHLIDWLVKQGVKEWVSFVGDFLSFWLAYLTIHVLVRSLKCIYVCLFFSRFFFFKSIFVLLEWFLYLCYITN